MFFYLLCSSDVYKSIKQINYSDKTIVELSGQLKVLQIYKLLCTDYFAIYLATSQDTFEQTTTLVSLLFEQKQISTI